MEVGSFGTIVFRASDKEVHTFNSLTRRREAKFAEHQVLEQKSKLQFVGVSLEETSFTVQLHAGLTDPEDRALAFWAAQESGEPRPLIIGRENRGDFVLVSIEQSEKYHSATGAKYIEMNLGLKEYN
ncbi:phage tail protein [Maridesulfovibrio sp.]|uniref:phage tail protein n=1 Tax=Maridesulfovibrio sp. TaxID=2795000 RepID=UPI003B00D0D5